MPKTVIPLFISIDSGATTTQFLNPRITLDREKRYIVRLINFTSFFTYPNVFSTTTIEGNQNNTLNFTVGAVNYTTTLPQGLYDIDSFNSAVSRDLVNKGLSSTLIIFTSDEPTQRVVVQLNAANVSINFTTSLCATLLGFNAVTIGPGTSGNYYYGNTTANFNRVVTILVHCSIAEGFYNNSNTVSSVSDVLASVTINAAPGSQIIYDPNNASPVYCNSSRIDSITLYVTDQDGRLLINNDPVTFTLEISED